MSRRELIKNGIEEISEYVPGKSIDEIALSYGLNPDAIIKLGSNENPLGPSPEAVDALERHRAHSQLSVYPSADAGELVKALSEYTEFPESNLVASGPGMDGLMDNLMRLVISKGDEVIIPTPTFSYYEIAARANGASPVFVKRGNDFNVGAESILEAESSRTKMIFICSPNNPSGNLIDERELRSIAESAKGLVFVDEAYAEFAYRNMSDLVTEYDNLVVGRTFSKAFGLAGMRIGYGIMPQWLKSEYMRVSTPFNLSRPAITSGIAALSDTRHLKQSVELARNGRKYLKDNIPFKVYDSQSNFVLVDVAPQKAQEICERLLEEGIIVRDCTSFRDAGDSLIRVTVGTHIQNKRVVEAFKNLYLG
ncbi:MAG: histidinol-phosphate transaminase [Methanohalobium sp.]|uniref:histidinol-phosphate transaminase n=1 Tax=Methanohalobium sp. TaxID=2837493 RepID=UPI0039799C23